MSALDLHEEIGRLTVILANVHGAVVDSGVPVPAPEEYPQAIRTLTRERDEARGTGAGLRTLMEALKAELVEAQTTIKSIATMLGWTNVPPRETLERDIRSKRARLEKVEAERDEARAALNGNLFYCPPCDLLVPRGQTEKHRHLEQAMADLSAAEAERDRLREALCVIAKWKLPPSGKTWDDGTPMSYGAAFGSNGERDYVRTVASNALAAPATGEAARQDGVEHG